MVSLEGCSLITIHTHIGPRIVSRRKNRLTSLKEDQNSEYVNIDKIKDELNSARKIFKENTLIVTVFTKLLPKVLKMPEKIKILSIA